MANYWDDPGRNRVANPNAPRASQTPPELIAAIRAAGQLPTEAQIQAALDYQDQQDPTGLAWKNATGAFGDRTYAMQEAANNDIAFNDHFAPVSRSTPIGPANTDFLSQLMGDSKSAIGDIWGGVSGIAQSVIGAAGGPGGSGAMSPADLLEQLRKQYGNYEYNGPSAETMVSREFDPQFAALNSEKAATQGRYNTNSKQMQGLYGAYANDVLKGRGENQQVYKQATNDINSGYGQAATNVTNNMNAATGEMGKQLALLNQNEAAPAVMQQKQEVLANQLGDLSKAQGTAAALSTQLGANTYASDTARHGIAQQAGLNAQADLSSQLEGLMQQYASQRMGLEGQRGAALNNYGMNIEKLMQEGQGSVLDAISKSFDSALRSQDTALDRELRQGSLDLDRKRLELDYDKFANPNSAATDPSKLNPYDALLNRSGQVNSNPQEAANDAEILYQTSMNEPNAQNLQVLMNMLDENNPGWLAQPGNKQLAYDYFSRVLASQDK